MQCQLQKKNLFQRMKGSIVDTETNRITNAPQRWPEYHGLVITIQQHVKRKSRIPT